MFLLDNLCTFLNTRDMPAVNGSLLKEHREYEMDLSPDEASGLLGISKGYLRNIEGEHDEPSKRLIGRIARIYRLQREAFVKKDEPKKEPRGEPTHPTKRQDKDTKAPKRATDRQVA